MLVLVSKTCVFECLDKACAPPPVGSGGSRRKYTNTSVIPKDKAPKIVASDAHEHAPGGLDTSLVRGHRGVSGDRPEKRVPRLGETVDVYRDLSRGVAYRRGFPDDKAFSVRMSSGHSGEQTQNSVAASTVGIRLKNPRPAWATAAKSHAEESGKRGVHAFVRGEVAAYEHPETLLRRVKSEPGWERVSYYPGTQDFFRKSDRRRFLGADEAVMANGEMHVKNARWHERTAPTSKIEQRIATGK